MFFKKILLLTLTLLLLLTCSCTKDDNDDLDPKENNPKEEESNSTTEEPEPEKTFFELVTKIYDKSELLEIAKFEGTIEELNSIYPIECLYETNYGRVAIYLGKDNWILTVPIELDNIAWWREYINPLFQLELLKSDFDKMQIGQTDDGISSLDINGDFSMFRPNVEPSRPRQSYHYTKDGYIISVEYRLQYIEDVDGIRFKRYYIQNIELAKTYKYGCD